MADFINPNNWIKRDTFYLEKITLPLNRNFIYSKQALLIICGDSTDEKILGNVFRVVETSKGKAALQPFTLKTGRNFLISPELGNFTLQFNFLPWVLDKDRKELNIEIWEFIGDFIYPPSGNNGGGNSFTKLSELENDTGFITANSLDWENIQNKPTLFSGSYTDLTDKPALFSGSYTDLTDKPTIPTTQKIKNVETLTGTKQLILTDSYFQFLTPSGNNRIVKLPIVNSTDYFECEIINTGNGTIGLAVQESDGTAVITLVNSGDKVRSIYAYWDGSMWRVFERSYYA